MNIRSPYSRLRVTSDTIGETMTEQSHAEASDINYIVRRFQRTGQLPPAKPGIGASYMDCTVLSGGLLELTNTARQTMENIAQAQAEQNAAKAAKPSAPAETTPAEGV